MIATPDGQSTDLVLYLNDEKQQKTNNAWIQLPEPSSTKYYQDKISWSFSELAVDEKENLVCGLRVAEDPDFGVY